MPRKHLQYGKAAEEAALSGASVNKEQKKINENLVFGGEVIPAGKWKWSFWMNGQKKSQILMRKSICSLLTDFHFVYMTANLFIR